MGVRTGDEIRADLVAAYAARRAAMNGSYTLDTGQGKQSVTRSLKEINEIVISLESELDAYLDDESGGGAVISATFRRTPN